jgi:protein O-mannosyl-transferase
MVGELSSRIAAKRQCRAAVSDAPADTMNKARLISERVKAANGPPMWLSVAILMAFIVVAYWPAFSAPFIYDDDDAIVRNPSITSLWPLFGTTAKPGPLNPEVDRPTAARPLVNLSFAMNYFFGDLNPSGYHAVNVIIHFLNAVLLWAIVRRTLRVPYFAGRFDASAGWLALAIALLWALHPLQTEAVVYVTQRSELMMAWFYFATLYSSLRYWSILSLPSGERWGEGEAGKAIHPHPVFSQRERGRRAVWLTLAVFACLAGMASKQVMASAPLVVLLYDRLFVSGSLTNALRRSWPLYTGLASTWLLLLALNLGSPYGRSAGFGVGVSPYVWLTTQAKVLLMYLKLVVWPAPLLIHYQFPYLETFATAWTYVVPVLFLGLATLVLLVKNHPLGFVGAWVFLILMPTCVVPIATEMAAERRMYLPLAAIAALLVVASDWLVEWVAHRRPGAWQGSLQSPHGLIGAATCLLAIIFCVVCAKRAAAYHNELALWQDVLRQQPQNNVAHENAGFYLDKAGKTAEAIEHYREAVRLDPDSLQTRVSLASLLLRTGSPDEAVTEFQKIVDTMPQNIGWRNNLATALYLSGRNDESIAAFRTVLESDPDNWAAHNNLGMALQKAARHAEAIESFQRALQLNPTHIDTYNDLTNSYVLTKQPEKAIATIERALSVAQASGDTARAEKFAAWLKANR